MKTIIGCLTDAEIHDMADSLVKLRDITIKLVENRHRPGCLDFKDSDR